jgi:hypothetical protein
MELLPVLGLIGLVAGGAALLLALDLRGRVNKLEAAVSARNAMDADQQSAHEAVHQELEDVRHEIEVTQHRLDNTQREVAELKMAAEVAPAPPLPKARPGGLDDLRERLRAAHSEPDAADEP